MGKKSKKTRWRTLTLNGHQSDSEESSSKSGLQTSKGYQKYPKFPYSSQSTPIRKFQHDSSKSTRSNSTTSEHKATFNEDEYTRITTPRQDVLFKKGYLNKPKSYQTQTSTGTSSTANSTSTCTPDHQSADGTEGTDLEYESQFVFPNGFIDQNGIYYINSFEPFPLVVYNAPICYSEYPSSRAKRYSTDSMAESLSPHNEETSQDASQNGEHTNSTPVINQAYVPPASYYYNGICTTSDGQYITEEPRRLKKRRRRKVSRSKSTEEATSEDDCDSSDEVFSQPPSTNHSQPHQVLENRSQSPVHKMEDIKEQTEETKPENLDRLNSPQEAQSETLPTEEATEETQSAKSNNVDAQNLLLQSLLKTSNPEDDAASSKYSLKPDAEEFIPRTFRAAEALPFDPNVQFLNFPPNFIPIPIVNHLGEFQRPPFLPPGIPLNFVPSQDPKMLPNFINLVPNGFVPKTYDEYQEVQIQDVKEEQEPEKPKEEKKPEVPEASPVKKQQKNEIDIAKIVSKLEEAAKQQRFHDKHQNYNRTSRYNMSRPYSAQRMRYNRHFRDNRQYPVENRYSRSHPNSSEERSYRKPEQRSKSNCEQEVMDGKKPEEPAQSEPEAQTEPDQKRLNQGDHHPVNNVNSRLGESCSIAKDLKLESTANYSKSLKKNMESVPNKCARYEKHNSERVERKPELKLSPIATPKPQRAQNQWISVSSRKKRKNRAASEELSADVEEPEPEVIAQNDDLFESFDVNQLVDVVPPSQLASAELPVETLEVSKEEENTTTEETMEDSAKTVDVIQESATDEVPLVEVEETSVLPPKSKKKSDQKKKSKKGTQKMPTKRVIITDVDLSLQDSVKPKEIPAEPIKEDTAEASEDLNLIPENENCEDLKIKDPVPEAPIKSEVEDLTAKTSVKNETLSSSSNNQTQTSESDTITDTPEKKSKKKKKKASKPVLQKIQSVSSSNTTLSNLDDSYDFLLENSTLEDFEQKTNVEISQELDRIIQKGMYSTLEEKIKSLQINADDGFFRTISYITPATQEKPNAIKAANFGSTQLLKAPQIGGEIDNQNLINIDFSKIKLPDLEPQPSTSKSGIFLENPLVNELIKNAADASPTKTKSNGRLKNKSKKNQTEEPKVTTGEDHNASSSIEDKNLSPSKFSSRDEPEPIKQESLYPITQAVKDWMTKTRENTPDVEILKSPNTIYKEFYGNETETKSDTTNGSKNGVGDPLPGKSVSRVASPTCNETKEGTRVSESNDDEIVIWSASPHNDLLDCWDNELPNGCGEKAETHIKAPFLIQNGDIKEIKGAVHNGQAHLNGLVEEGEEAIEVYDSKYGKNEDFLRLKAEIEEQRNLNFPRHGNLPYRAICCSIM